MERQKGAQTLLIAVLAVAVLAMSIGFAAAAYNQNLEIGGTNNVTAKAAKWSVHYDTATYAEQTGSVAASAHNLTNTAWTFTVTLEPGDTYEATATVVNDGTFDAKLSSITMSALTSDQDAYLDWSVFVNDVEYQATTNNLNVSLPKAENSVNGTNTVKVLVKYIIPSNPSVLPTTDQTVTLSATLGYESVVQAGA